MKGCIAYGDDVAGEVGVVECVKPRICEYARSADAGKGCQNDFGN